MYSTALSDIKTYIKIRIILVGGLLALLIGESASAGQCTERKWRQDYPRSQESGLICESANSKRTFYIFSKSKDCAFELYYRNGKILAQSYLVNRYIGVLNFAGLSLDRKSLLLKKGDDQSATCHVAQAEEILQEYDSDVSSKLKENKF